MLEQKAKSAWRAFIAAKDTSADVSERAWEDLHFTERNAWFSAFRAFVVPTDDPQPVQELSDDASPVLVLLAVEESIKNGGCPWQIEQAFEEYESQRQAAITKGTT